MKKIILILCIGAIGHTSAHAQNSMSTSPTSQGSKMDKKESRKEKKAKKKAARKMKKANKPAAINDNNTPDRTNMTNYH